MRPGVVIYGLCLAMTCAVVKAGPPVGLRNAGFETWRDGQPEGWSWGISRDAKATLDRDEEVRHGGQASARLASKSPRAPHVFGGLHQEIKGLTPERRYRVRAWVRGQEVGEAWFGGGPDWATRFEIPTGTYGWQEIEGEFMTGPEATSWHLRINVDSATGALWVDDVSIERLGPDIDNEKLATLVANDLAAVERQLPDAKRLLEQARAKKIPTDYPQLKLAVVERFIGYGRDDLSHHRYDRASRVADHIKRLLKEASEQLTDALAGKRALPAVPRFRTSKVEVDAWHFMADAEIPSTGKRERRPVFFNGYGHFAQSRRDIPNFQALGANIIQIEQGPRSTVQPEFSVDMRHFDDYIMGGLADGAKHDVMVCLLTSPHYFPDWAYKNWPHLAGINGGFIKFAIDPPEARRVHETHLKAVTERVKASPALHSICLSNEPMYIDSRKDATTQQMWLAYLTQHHGSIEQLNARYGAQYRSFEDVKIPPPSVPEVPRTAPGEKPDPGAVASHRTAMAVLHDWVRFNNQRFSDWHRWMGQVVHGIAPHIRVHAKIMPTVWTRSRIVCGVAPEQFCGISNLNGCDCWQMIDRSKGGRYACNWRTEHMFYDLLASMRTAPGINTEDHLIRDRDNLPVPAGHTYTVLWEGAIHRLGASMVWVWERTYDPKHDFAGSILHRPENVEAAGRAHLDLMRLSREVVAMQNAPRRVGLLFSITAIVHDKDYLPAIQRTYEALSFTGLPVRFVSENQLVTGRWDDVKVLIVPRVTHVPKRVGQAVVEFAAADRHVIFVGRDCLTCDEYGHTMRVAGLTARKRGPNVTVLGAGLVSRSRHTLPDELRDRLMHLLKAAAIESPAVLTDSAGQPVLGIEWQAVRYGGRMIVNLVNLTKKPIAFGVTVKGKRREDVRDLIGLRDVAMPCEAQPLEPMLLELPG